MARPLFPGHYQPHIPSDLGFYDLRCQESRIAQAELAQSYGVDGFCYWHYWLGNGIEFLERPAQEILRDRKPDFPFCFAWANHDWKSNCSIFGKSSVLIKQEYPGIKDYTEHFYSVLPYFRDKRYIKIDGKPLFMIYQPTVHNDIPLLIKTWRRLAKESSLGDIFFIGHMNFDVKGVTPEMIFKTGVDSINVEQIWAWYWNTNSLLVHLRRGIQKYFFKTPVHVPYKVASRYFLPEIGRQNNVFPSVIPNWDNTPRRKEQGIVFTGSTPELFREHLLQAFDMVKDKPESRQVIFLKSWNEWAEGNYVEPDMKFGTGFLEAIKEAKQS